MNAAGRQSGKEEYGFKEEKAVCIWVFVIFLMDGEGVLSMVLKATKFLTF